MDAVYVPAHVTPCEFYWLALLDEGPLSRGKSPGPWEWQENSETFSDFWEEARKFQEGHCIFRLKIDGYNKGGLIAHWNAIECFVPASHLLDYPFPADPAAREECFKEYLERELRLCVIEVEPTRSRILLSERQVDDCEMSRASLPEWLCPDVTCEGLVTSIRPFGIFVDIGPLEGMVHISELSWGRVRYPGDLVSTGDKVKVMILSVDVEHQRVGLSLKRLLPNPWDTVEEYLSPGDKVSGKVVGVERFGVFVELVNGLEGLLHISELCSGNNDGRADSVRRNYREGDPIDVKILDIVPEDHRIALGLLKRETGYAAV